MFSVFPSDLVLSRSASQARPPVPPCPAHAPVPSGSVATVRQRFANGDFHFQGASLPYPASLPTSGINGTIVEFRQGDVGVTAPNGQSEKPPSQGMFSGWTSPIAVPPPASAPAEPIIPRPQGSPAPARPARQLVVPVLTESIAPFSAPFQKTVVDRIAFNFSQRPTSAPVDDDLFKEVLLDNMEVFEAWMKVQCTLQSWRREEKVDMTRQAETVRKKAAQLRKQQGRECVPAKFEARC